MRYKYIRSILMGCFAAGALLACVAESSDLLEDQGEGVDTAPVTVVAAPNGARVIPILNACALSFACPTEQPNALSIQGLSQDATSLYLSVTLAKANARRKGATLQVSANGAEPTSSDIQGSVGEAPNETAWFSVPLAALPDGELELSLRVAGEGRTLVLVNRQGQISQLGDDAERKNFRRLALAAIQDGAHVPGVVIDGPSFDVRVEVGP